MYFPIGWPKSVNLALPGESRNIKHICFDAVKILLAAVGSDVLGIWYANPLVPIVFYNRSVESVVSHGENKLVVWKPDSRQLIVLTMGGTLILYQVDFDTSGNGIFMQMDSPFASLKRDSAELFIKENIPKIGLREVCYVQLNSLVTAVCCISLSELLVATRKCELLRMQWSDLEIANMEGTTPVTSAINLHLIQFYVNQHCNLKTIPPVSPDSYVAAMEYSPFIGGCAAVFSDNRAAFVIANHLRFETASMHAFWIPEVLDATACSVNHKFRLISFGRANSDVSLYAIEDTTGGLEFSHTLSLNSNVLPGTLGSVCEIKWSPDGCVLAVAWENGGIAMWSTFGSLLMSSFSWDFGIHVDLINENPLCISKMEWSTEGYQLYLTRNLKKYDDTNVPQLHSSVYQINFVKSALTMNPCMTAHPHVLLQGDDTLYLNQGDNLEKNYFGDKFVFPNKKSKGHPRNPNASQLDECLEIEKSVNISSILAESKYWNVLQLPQTYMSTNWPIRYSAIDASGIHIAVAGRTGLAHYSMLTKRWKLFGNETQEKDFVVSGGLMWWRGFIVCGCYSLLDRTDEIRCYPEECKLDNEYGNRIQVRAPVISLNIFRNQMIALTADGFVTLFAMNKCDAYKLRAECIYEIDVKSICIHPACIVSLSVTNLRNDLTTKVPMPTENGDTAETIIVNVCGRILMIQRNSCSEVGNSLMASCLASCVEVFWLSNTTLADSPMRDCLWLFSGIHGMRVWLPILPPSTEQRRDLSHRMHTFMSKRIMLSFPLKLYPLAILFDNVIVLGVENETVIYTSEPSSHFALPYSQLERKSQVYLHKILRQLIKRNLGYSAWEIAQSCRRLPYFPHSLELLLHEVLEEEATSKDPIPDALLPSILDFIREFPVYLQTIVQCARKTEIALWPYLFSMAGKPKDLFQQCLESEELVTAASYLIILQNLEPSVISKQYATLLLEVSLQHKNWELAKDLIRFLKAIDPNEIDSPRSSMVVNVKIAPPNQSQAQVNQNPEAFNLILGPIGRERSFSTTVIASNTAKEKKEKLSLTAAATTQGSETLPNSSSGPIVLLRRKSDRSNLAKNDRRETFCIEIILQKHARKLLQNCKLIELGYMSAYLDFHLVAWLSQEAEKSALLDDYVTSLCQIHKELNLQSPCSPQYHLDVDSDQNYHQLHHNKSNSDQQLNMPLISSQTSESGYYSLTLLDTPTSTNNANVNLYHNIPSIYEDEEVKYSMKPTVSVHDCPLQEQTNAVDCFKSRHCMQTSLDCAVYKPIYSTIDEISASPIGFGINCGVIYPKILPEKISIKIRYLLQLFIEANCIDMALVLSILLQDASSIGRIINVLTRSESLATCIRIQNLLKRFAIWSFDVVCVYRSFMISLQPYIYFLDQFVQSSSTPMAPVSISKLNALGSVQNNRMENSDPNDFIQSTDKDGSEQSLNFEHENEINRKWSHENYNNEEKRKNSSRPLNSDSSYSCNTHPSYHQGYVKQSLSSVENVNDSESSGCNIM